MKSRHLAPLAALALLCVVGLWIVLSGGGPDVAPIAVAPDGTSGTPTDGDPGENRSATATKGPTSAQEVPDGTRTDGTRPQAAATSGTIEGRIVLASGLPQAITGYTILFEEAVNPNAPRRESEHPPRSWTRGFKADPGYSPLFFSEREVPFSTYGYRVTVFVPGINGSSQFVRCDASNAYSEVSLSLTPGSPFSLRLIDQYRAPVVGHRVQLRPTGWPNGRPFEDRTSDSFGVAVFEALLAGTWDVALDDVPVGSITVDPPGMVNDEASLGVQSAVLTIPLGRAVKVEAFDPAGHGLQDVDLTLIATETTQNRRVTARTDNTGCWTFPYVQPGRWQLSASGAGRYAPTTRIIEVPADRDPLPVQIRLQPTR